MPQAQDLQAVLSRIEKLESQSRRWRLTALFACIACGSLLAMRPALSRPQAARTVTAQEFILVDAAGKARARLGFTYGSPGLKVMDTEGRTRAMLTPGGLSLLDAKHRERLSAGLDDRESEGCSPWLYLYDEHEHARVGMTVHKGREPMVFVIDERKYLLEIKP